MGGSHSVTWWLTTAPFVTPQVDDRNIISPTLSLKKGYVTYGWKHLLGEGGELTAVLDPFEVS